MTCPRRAEECVWAGQADLPGPPCLADPGGLNLRRLGEKAGRGLPNRLGGLPSMIVLAGKRVEDAVLDLADLKRGPLQGSLFLRDERFAPLEERP